jgi:tetratricopeptide (TPR) repeat protein
MRRRWWVVPALYPVILPLGGCSELPPHGRHQLERAHVTYETGDATQACLLLDKFLAEFPSHPESAEGYYMRSLCRIKSGRLRDARSDLERCLSLSVRSDLTARAYAALGGLQHDAGDLDSAAASYERALRDLPERPPTDQVRHRYGLCLQRLGRWPAARQMFATVIQQYPNSPYVEDARRRFSWSRPYFAIQCGAFVQEKQADEFVGKLRTSVPSARKEPEARLGRPMYVVYAGQYATYAEAQQQLGAIRQKAPGAFIVP